MRAQTVRKYRERRPGDRIGTLVMQFGELTFTDADKDLGDFVMKVHAPSLSVTRSLHLETLENRQLTAGDVAACPVDFGDLPAGAVDVDSALISHAPIASPAPPAQAPAQPSWGTGLDCRLLGPAYIGMDPQGLTQPWGVSTDILDLIWGANEPSSWPSSWCRRCRRA